MRDGYGLSSVVNLEQYIIGRADLQTTTNRYIYGMKKQEAVLSVSLLLAI